MSGMLLHKYCLNKGVKGPRIGQYRSGWKINSEQPQAYFCQRFTSSSQVRDTPSSNLSSEYVAHRRMYPFICKARESAKSSDTWDSDQILRTPSSSKMISCNADQRRKALCPTNGAVDPLAQQNEIASWMPLVKCAMPFSKK